MCSTTCHFAFAQNESSSNDSQQNCTSINNHAVVNGSEAFFVIDCTLHPILDTQTYNDVIVKSQTAPIELSDKFYAKLSVGKPYTLHFNDTEMANICTLYNKQIVSSDNIAFYYIENCQKRKFLTYYDVELFTNSGISSAIGSIPESALKKIPSGKLMPILKLTSPSEQTNTRNLPNRAAVCRELTNKVQSQIVSYYGSIFYLKNCKLEPISNITIDRMQEANDAGGIYELSTPEILLLPQVTQWNNKN